MVYRHCGINLHEGKVPLVRARIAKRLRAGGFSSVAQYLDRVEADAGGPEFTALIDAMSTNLTSFFREIRHFEFLATGSSPGCWSGSGSAGATESGRGALGARRARSRTRWR
jgi:chemotaxis protein methyltransferase CheR